MAKAGKILALIAGLLTFIGTFAFSLVTVGPLVTYGIGGVMSLIDLFSVVSTWPVIVWIFVVCYILFLLSFALQLLGMKSRIAAFFGSLLPLAVVAIVFLGVYNVWPDGLGMFALLFGNTSLVVQWVPMTFGFGLPFPGGIIDLGTFIVGVGGLLSLVSVFLTREDY